MTWVGITSSRPIRVLVAIVLVSVCAGAKSPELALSDMNVSTPGTMVPSPTLAPTLALTPDQTDRLTPPPPTPPLGMSRAIGVEAGLRLEQTPLPTPRPAPTLVRSTLRLPQDATTTWHLPGSPKIVAMRDTIVNVLRANELEFDLGYPVQGFSPDPTYPRLFARDTSTLMAGASYFYPPERLRWSVEAFLRQQYDYTTASNEDGWAAGFGAISATVGPDGAVDKASAVSDEEPHLVHAAYYVYRGIGGVEWLTGEINGLPVIARLNAAGDGLLLRRRDEGTGLIKRDHTTDWGDVRFQTASGNPTDAAAGDVVWTASIYDQALAYRAWRELAVMNNAVGDRVNAGRWEAEADALRRATNRHLWQAGRGFYLTHIHLTPLEHDFDEGAMVSIANAVAIICGLTDTSQNATILTTLENARLEAGAAKVGLVLYPPYPDGFFAFPHMQPGNYQNGGIWDWWGGWQVLAEFESGHSQLARTHLSQTAADWAVHPGQVFEWQQVTTMAGRGGDQYAGAAAIYAHVIVEGLYGVSLYRNGLALSPRLGDWPGSITVRQPGTGLYLRYSYQPSTSELALAYDTNHQAPAFPFQLLLPPGFKPGQARLDGVSVAWEGLSPGQDAYLVASLPSGRHLLVVEADTPPNRD
jgi:hypothetical protein